MIVNKIGHCYFPCVSIHRSYFPLTFVNKYYTLYPLMVLFTHMIFFFNEKKMSNICFKRKIMFKLTKKLFYKKKIMYVICFWVDAKNGQNLV